MYATIDIGGTKTKIGISADLNTFSDIQKFPTPKSFDELPTIPRDSYILGTKLGRYAPRHFDFSAKRVIESVDISLERMRTDHLDIVLCHDLEYVEMSQIVEETLPALRRLVQKGKVRYIGVSGYPMKMFKYVLQNSDDVDVILTYNHYTLQNDMALELVPLCQQKG